MLLIGEDGQVKRYWTYVGCSYGDRGVQHRIRDHLNPAYRKRKPSRHYEKMDMDGVQSHFVSLLRFPDDSICFGEIVLCEMICAMLFGAYTIKFLREIRAEVVHDCPVDPRCNTNRTSPLVTEDRSATLRQIAELKREALFRRSQDGGSVKIRVCGRLTYFFISSLQVYVTMDHASYLQVGNGDDVNIRLGIEDNNPEV